MHSRAALLTTYLLLLCSLQQTIAQDSDTDGDDASNLEGCVGVPDEPANRTGTFEFPLTSVSLGSNVSMYLTQDLHDYRHGPTSMQTIAAWLSVPEDIEGRACVYAIPAQNSTRDSEDLLGCDGILSTSCIAALRNAVGFSADGECISPFNNAEIADACPENVFVGLYSPPIEFSNTTCSIAAPQSDVGAVPQEGYRTWAASVQGLSGDEPSDNFGLYDLRGQQAYPYVVAVGFEDEVARETVAEVVCVAPNITLAGARLPDTPLPGSAGRVGVMGVGELAVGVVGLMAYLAL